MRRGSALARRGGGGCSDIGPGPIFDTAVLYLDAAREPDRTNLGTAGSALDGAGARAVDEEKAAIYGASEAQASTCPDAAALDLTAGFVVWADIDTLWQKPLPSSLLAKPTDGGTVPGETEDCYAVGVGVDGIPYIEWFDGAHFARTFSTTDPEDPATATVAFDADEGRKQLGWEFIGDNGAGGWTARLHSGTPTSHTLLSETVNTTDGAQAMETSSEALRVGDFAYGAVYRLRLYDELDGTLLADFYPERDHTSGTSMTSDTGEVWSNVVVPTEAAFPYVEIADDAALDIAADADGTYAFWATISLVADSDGELYTFALRETGTLGQDGNGLALRDIKIAAFFADFAGAVVGDGADQGLVVGAHWAAGRHLFVLNVDRTADEATLYVDGEVHAGPTDISAVGAIAPDADLVLSAAAHHAVAKWDAVVDPGAIAAARA